MGKKPNRKVPGKTEKEKLETLLSDFRLGMSKLNTDKLALDGIEFAAMERINRHFIDSAAIDEHIGLPVMHKVPTGGVSIELDIRINYRGRGE